MSAFPAFTDFPATPEAPGAPRLYDLNTWFLEPTHFTTDHPNYIERLRKLFTDLGVEVSSWDPSWYSGKLRYQTPGGITFCEIKLVVLIKENGTHIIEFQRFDGDHFAFNRFFHMIRSRFQGLPDEEERAPAPAFPVVNETPLDPETVNAEWRAINAYLDSAPSKGLRIITNLARQGVRVPADTLSRALSLPQDWKTRDTLSRALSLPQDWKTRSNIIALLAMDHDYTGIETVVRTALTGFVPYFAEMRARYEEAATLAITTPPERNQLYITRGEIDLQRYCLMVDRLSPDLIGDALPAVMEVLEIARDRTTWIQTQEIAVETFSRLVSFLPAVA